MASVEEVVLAADHVNAIIARQLPGGTTQTLVLTDRAIHTLLGLDANPNAPPFPEVRLGPPISLTERTPDGQTLPYTWTRGGDGVLRAPLYGVYEPAASGYCYLSTRDSILRLDSAGVVEQVVGQRGSPGKRDGPANVAQVQSPVVLAADGAGGLVFADGQRDVVRQVRPAAAVAPPPAARPALAAALQTVPLNIPDWSLIHALSYDYATGTLYVCTPRVVYRATDVAAGAAGRPTLQLLAGSEEASGFVDGTGRGAQFGSICDAVVDSRGRLYVTDMEGPDGAVVRQIDPAAGAVVRTLPARLGELSHAARLALLPGGWLCVYEWGGNKAWFMQVGADPSRPPAPPVSAAAAPPPSANAELAALVQDLHALLSDPWHTADVVVTVAGTSFPAHSQVLTARSEYFRRRLLTRRGPPAPDGAAAAAAVPDSASSSFSSTSGAPAGGGGPGGPLREVALADADPVAFAALLSYIYTANLEVPESLLRQALELATRLVLPRAVIRLQQLLTQAHQQQPQQPQWGAVAAAGIVAAASGSAVGAASHGYLAVAPSGAGPGEPPAAAVGGVPGAAQPQLPPPQGVVPQGLPPPCLSQSGAPPPGAPVLAQTAVPTQGPPSAYGGVPPAGGAGPAFPQTTAPSGPPSAPSPPSTAPVVPGPSASAPTASAPPSSATPRPPGPIARTESDSAPSAPPELPPPDAPLPSQAQMSYPSYSNYSQGQDYGSNAPTPASYGAPQAPYPRYGAASSQPSYGGMQQSYGLAQAPQYGAPAPYGAPQASSYGPQGGGYPPVQYPGAQYGAQAAAYPGQGYPPPPQMFGMPPQGGGYYMQQR